MAWSDIKGCLFVGSINLICGGLVAFGFRRSKKCYCWTAIISPFAATFGAILMGFVLEAIWFFEHSDYTIELVFESGLRSALYFVLGAPVFFFYPAACAGCAVQAILQEGPKWYKTFSQRNR